MRTAIVTRKLILAVLPLALISASTSFAQTATDRLTPTIPETQIEPAPLSSPYEFLSVATSASDFVSEAAALASANEASEAVTTLAADLAATHAALKAELVAAGKADSVEIAKPAVDGEQAGLLGKLEPLKGVEFDRAYVESQIFGHQRAIAYYRGFADRTTALGAFAKETLQKLVADYSVLVATAEQFAQAQPAAQQ
jgi:predicted outer membrane protein